ncbi:hypothetical protein Tco_0943327 [Tanacetum coccineum]
MEYSCFNEAVHKELGDRLLRAATTASSLESEQDSGNITKTRSKATPNESSSLRTTSGGGPSEDASKQGRRINTIDVDEYITLVNVQYDADNEIFDVDALTGDEVFVAELEVAAKDVNLTVDEVTLAQALATLKSVKPKVKGDVIKEPSVPVSAASASTKVSAATTITATIPTPRKGIVITELEPEPVKPKKKDAQIMLDEEAAKRLQAEFDEEERLAREKVEKEKEANIALTKEWEDIERKHFAAKRAEEQRNKETNHQHKLNKEKIMCTYLKNMEGKKLKDLKNKSFDSIQKMFDIAFKRVNTFVDFRIDLVKELQSLMEVIPDEKEVAIDVVPLATKSPSIVDWKIHKEGKKSYYQIMKADGKSQIYVSTAQELQRKMLSVYYCQYTVSTASVKLLLLYKVNAAKGVNAASEEVSTA